MPVFWLGIILVLLFYRQLGWLPFGGRLDPSLNPPPRFTGLYLVDSLLSGEWATFWSALSYLILPAVTLAYSSLAIVSRMTRSSLLEVLQEDYVRTARAKGLSERVVITRHALRNALIPVMTITGLQFGALLGGAFLVEVIFSWPGLGHMLVRRIYDRDFSTIQGTIVVFAFLVAAVSLLVDVIYAYIDPRIRY
jgi:peptide/nickel transport system permease protein